MEPTKYFFSLQDAFFPVDYKNLFWEDNAPYDRPYHVPIKRFRAIVALDTREMLSAVTDTYKLITNEEAYDWAIEIAHIVFHVQDGIKMNCISVRMPQNRASCEIDLVRNIEQGQPEIIDEWKAFIHLENSYNKTKTLSYNIGFYNPKYNRKLIDKMFSIDISETHMKTIRDMHECIIQRACQKFSNIPNIESLFLKKINSLKEIEIAQNDMIPLFCKFNNIRQNKELSNSSIERYILLYDYLRDLVSHCIRQYGPNAFCMLNVMTDYATNYRDSGMWLHFSTKQIAVGKWVDDIIAETKDPNFSMHRYIGDDAGDAASWMQTLFIKYKHQTKTNNLLF